MKTGGILINAKFKDRVLFVVSQIPKGETRTYGEVAHHAGSPNAFRAVGTILSHNYNSKIPCHRVVRADGKSGEWNRGAVAKERLLKKEGAI